jgi:hypothetical protein
MRWKPGLAFPASLPGRGFALTVLTALAAGGLFAAPASAGCGCEKPPPVPAEIRPRATYAGAPVTLFAPALQEGRSYAVEFVAGTTGARTVVDATAVLRRDLADGVAKVQLVLPVPSVPLGPTGVTVWDGGTPVSAVDDDAFTVTAAPVVFSDAPTRTVLSGYRAGVSRGGVVYVALDLSQVASPLVIRAQLRGYPLRFAADDLVFYNTQGFLMQALDGAMPGLFTLAAPHAPADSDVLQYSRHEFNTYFLQHAERQPHAVAADDPNWHLDGTPHIDHDHLVLALAATLADGTSPAPGETPPADLVLETFSLFGAGLAAVGDVTLSTAAYTTSYDSRTLAAGHAGDVLSGGLLSLTDGARVDGTEVAAAFAIDATSAITGETLLCRVAPSTMPVQIPAGLIDLGAGLGLSRGGSVTLVGPGSYLVGKAIVPKGAQLTIVNAKGPVTLYVSDRFELARDATVTIVDPDPEKFAVYVVGSGPVNLARSSAFAGVVYAPQASVELSQGGVFYGAFVGSSLRMTGASGVAYDVALRGDSGPLRPAELAPYVAPTPVTNATRVMQGTTTRSVK